MDNTDNLKPVTFLLPGHLANLIEETRNRLPGQWEEWIAAPANLDIKSFDACLREFEALFVDSNWTFDGPADRAEFMAPLIVALRKAHGQQAEVLTA